MRIFRAPKFWNEVDSKTSRALEPLAKLYGIISSLKINSVIPTKVSVPVICIGNVVLGGAGKTPTVALICSILKKYQYNPHILTAGYGGYIKNVVKVDSSMHSYLQVGDEALLSALVSPTWIGRNRVNSAKAATIAGANVLVMDDGFQNNSLEKDFKVLVVDSCQQFGNGRLFPAGPLRETADLGIKKSDAVLIIGEKNETLENKIKQVKQSISIFRAKMKVVGKPKIENKKAIGFCGLGYPDKFRKTLLECGFEIEDFIAFSDHHLYTITEIQKLIKAAKNSKSALITTRKDYVKIPDVFKNEISVIDIKLALENDLFEKELISKITP
ncbi:MAG: tetraacyldisaccharide 4'-kinase [Holosporales bacterium]|jgi:tetraacyldisaccharide 4'-kinase|nr:tetraacyldisaccharide 4'-kinase [Holosporales bacterium]